MQSTGSQPKIIVGIVGAGISGLAVANVLLNDLGLRYDVEVNERDTIAFDSECGGYQIHIASNGLIALKRVSDQELWDLLREARAGDTSAAPAVVDPKEYKVRLELSKYKA
jgi:2-polyprenyl-6-methoxyphenol hydroxylase-like FAD-dependent oxidoreductase